MKKQDGGHDDQEEEEEEEVGEGIDGFAVVVTHERVDSHKFAVCATWMEAHHWSIVGGD